MKHVSNPKDDAFVAGVFWFLMAMVGVAAGFFWLAPVIAKLVLGS